MTLQIGSTGTLQDGRRFMILSDRFYRWRSSNLEDYGAKKELHYFNGLILDNGEPCSWADNGRYAPLTDHPLNIAAIDATGN